MLADSEKSPRPINRIGIECESIEDASWGVGRIVYKLLEELSRRPELAARFRIYLYFKSRIPEYPFLDSPLFIKRVTRPEWFPASFNLHYHVWMLLCAYRDGVRTLYFPNYMLPLLWFKKSVVMLTDDIWHEIRNPQLPFRFRLAYRIFGTWAARRATRIMAISHASAAEVTRLFGVPERRIVVNELAVDAPNAPRGAIRTTPYLLYVGQAFPRRNLRETLLAFERIAPNHPNLQLVCVGPDKYTPPMKDQLIAEINARLKRQTIVSFEHVSDSDLAALYANATALIYVSAREGFGLPPLEALAYGTPPVVADTSVTREIYGTHAFFVPHPITPETLAPVLERAVSDSPMRQVIRNAAPGILSRYTWQAHTDRFLHSMTTL
jgi:glycosyltransferase involved in cell wall biosynthesis